MFRLYFYSIFLVFNYVNTSSNINEIKIDYYEALIKNGIRDANNYKPRVDNREFFQNCKNFEENDFGTFDFIIVGAGSSGSVVANRLSENPHWKILILEAGDEEDDLSEIPGLHVLLPSSVKNWGYTSTRQKYGCYGMIGGKCPYARGKAIGGSGAINGLLYFKGNKDDYDKWEKWGNEGWSYKNLSKYFAKSENSQIPDGDDGYHGFAGPLNNAYAFPESPLIEAFINANEKNGVRYIDLNGKYSEGVGRCQNNILFGRRVSGGSSYLKNARNRINLNVTTNAYVIKIIIEKNTKIAQGVIFVKNGIKYKALAKKEVIISGGSINSPQLLMLSGVGPRKDLEKHGIEVIQDLPVGKNLRDHIAFINIYFRTNVTNPTIPLRKQINDYLNGFGPLTSSFGSKAIALKTINKYKLEIVIVAPEPKGSSIFSPRNFNEESLQSMKVLNTSTDFILSSILLNPESTGRITLKSANADDFPEIDIGIFRNEDDLNGVYEGIKYAHKIIGSEIFKKYNATPIFQLKPCDKYGYGTRSFWFCAIRHLAFNSYHMSSTVKMGPWYDPDAVVDDELRVYGIHKLRVVDCSIMPDTVSGHTNAIAFAIGEKASDIIKNCHRTST